ncbi:hypothetical protein ACLMAL_31335 [Nocardia sp. CWNU-33]
MIAQLRPTVGTTVLTAMGAALILAGGPALAAAPSVTIDTERP